MSGSPYSPASGPVRASGRVTKAILDGVDDEDMLRHVIEAPDEYLHPRGES